MGNDNKLAIDVLNTLEQVHRNNKKPIALHEPCFCGNEWSYVKECLDTGWVSSVGKYVDLFEQRLAEITGAKKAVALVNGTAALHICLLIAGVEANDEVLIPTLTFIATGNAVKYCNAIPHFADSELSTLGLAAHKLDDYLAEISVMKNGACINKKTGRRIKAVVPMHTFGHPVDIEGIMALCQKYNLVFVEDAAESLGSYYNNKHTGNFGHIAALSFNGNKTVTTGGGGAILTNDENLAKLAKHLTTQAKVPHRWEFNHDMVGYNYRLPNINAALGVAQLESLDKFIANKRALAEKYRIAFQNLEGVDFVVEPSNSKSNYWLNALLLSADNAKYRDEILEITNQNNISTRPAWNLLHTMPIFADCPRMDCSTAVSIAQRLINIPSSPCLS